MRELYVQADPNVGISNRYPISAELIADYVKEISKDGIDVHSIGMSDEGILIRVSAQTGSVSLSIESENVFDPEHYFSWAKRFPYGYLSFNATDLSGLNDVEKSMARIGISPTNYGRPMLLIPDVRLQSIPPNLILVGERIAGFDIPIAVAPSMTWLKAIRSVQHVATGSRTAWIPASEPTLVTLATVLSSPLADYEFSTSLDPLPPSHMKNSDIAVIGAHGGLQEQNEWFQAVTDKVSTRLTTRDLAAKLSGCAVVVLFVCSGGRLDPHPFASVAVGLPQLLLDHGCRTVIASPWPLDITVANHWLPAFLSLLVQGQTVISANHAANKRVAAQLNSHPMLSLAMNVFGDPLTRLQSEVPKVS
jgi:hypothetical protein